MFPKKGFLRKTTQLKNLIQSSDLEFIMEAHNALSAQIVEEAGFKGIWASGLSISAALGVRDNNEASWTQVLEVLEFMSDKTDIPILMDGDTGYGNFNNARRLVRKLEQREIAGVCLEDKLFPKNNSFINSEMQPLADIQEFCGKIKAAKDTQRDDDFVLVARTEAFIAGWGLEEAMRRAIAYADAGADAILIHSAKAHVKEIEAFMKQWDKRIPVVIVPTKYYSTPTDLFRKMGVSLVIWANHNLRASVSAMQNVCQQIFEEQTLLHVEEEVSPLGEIFRLQGADELKDAEKKYLPTTGKSFNTIILADSWGDDLGEIASLIPKAMIPIQGKTVLSTQIENYQKMGIKDLTVVRGFAKETVTYTNVKTIDNDKYMKNGSLYSLYLARNEIKENTVICNGDIIFKSHVLHTLLIDENDITLIVDADSCINDKHKRYFVKTSEPYSRKLMDKPVVFQEMAHQFKDKVNHGEFISLWKVNKKGAEIVRNTLEELSKHEKFKKMTLADLLNEISKTHPIAVKFIKSSWLDIYTIVELQKSGSFDNFFEPVSPEMMEEMGKTGGQKLGAEGLNQSGGLSLYQKKFLDQFQQGILSNQSLKKLMDNLPQEVFSEPQKQYNSLFNMAKMKKYFDYFPNPMKLLSELPKNETEKE